MTHGQPPQPPSGGQPPDDGPRTPPDGPPPYGQPPPSYGGPQYGQPQYGQPQYGQPPGYAPPPGQPSYGPPQYGQQPAAPPYGPPAAGSPGSSGAGISFDLKKLTMADYVIAGGALLFFVLALFPWWSYGDDLFGYSLSGFDDGTVSTAFLLLLLAAAWTVVPAVLDLRLGFPRAWVTVGLAGLGFVLTLVAWIQTMGVSFQIWPLLGLLTAGAVLAFAILSLLPQLRDRPALPGSLAGAAQWANQPAPDLGRPGQQAHPHGQAGHVQPTPPPPPPPPPGSVPGTPYPGPGTGSPDRPPGS